MQDHRKRAEQHPAEITLDAQLEREIEGSRSAAEPHEIIDLESYLESFLRDRLEEAEDEAEGAHLRKLLSEA